MNDNIRDIYLELNAISQIMHLISLHDEDGSLAYLDYLALKIDDLLIRLNRDSLEQGAFFFMLSLCQYFVKKLLLTCITKITQGIIIKRGNYND